MKNILLLVHDDVGQEARLQAALDVTRAVAGHLTCVDVVEMPMVVDGFYGGTGEMILLEDARTREQANKARLEARLVDEDVSFSFVDGCGDLGACLVQAAGTADLVVVNRKLDAFPSPDMRGVARDVLTGTDKLVLAVSDRCQRFVATGRALVAWDGSQPAMRALQCAVPLLRLAGAVKIVQVGTRDQGIPLEDAAAYLSRHDIHAEIEMQPDTKAIAPALRQAARDFGADWMVMGAYKHRPTTEFLFGGVTREMLTEADLPLLLAH